MSRTSPLCFSIYLCQFHLNFHHTYKKPSRQHVLYEEIHLACFSHNWPTRVVFLIETSLLIMWLGCRIRTLWNLLKWLNIWSKDLERRARFTLYILSFFSNSAVCNFLIMVLLRKNHSIFHYWSLCVQIVHIQEIPSREASFTELPCHLSEAMREALASIGISRLYSHQVCHFWCIFSC